MLVLEMRAALLSYVSTSCKYTFVDMLLWVHFCGYTFVDIPLILPFNCLILPSPLYTFNIHFSCTLYYLPLFFYPLNLPFNCLRDAKKV